MSIEELLSHLDGHGLVITDPEQIEDALRQVGLDKSDQIDSVI